MVEAVSVRKVKGEGFITNSDQVFFTLLVQPPTWKMEVRYTDGSLSETVFDGKEAVHIYNFGHDLALGLSVTNIATLSLEEQPFDFEWPVQLPWYAWASSSFFARSNWSLMPPPWLSPKVDELAAITTNAVEFIGPSNLLPRHASFYVSEELKKTFDQDPIFEHFRKNSSESRAMLERQLLRITNHTCLGEYKVSATTNFAGRELPLGFELRRNPSRTNAMVSYFIRGYATNFALVKGKIKKSGPIQPANVIDYRFRRVYKSLSYVSYPFSASKSWPELNNPVVYAALEHRLGKGVINHSVLNDTSSNVFKFAVITFLILCLIAMLVFLQKMKGKKS